MIVNKIQRSMVQAVSILIVISAIAPVGQICGAVKPDKVQFWESALVPNERGVDVVNGANQVDLDIYCSELYCAVLLIGFYPSPCSSWLQPVSTYRRSCLLTVSSGTVL